MKRITSIIIAYICFSISMNAQGLQSPKEFLRTEYGQHFTPHYLVAEYVKHVAANSDRVTLIEYGQTNEDRPLLLATITCTHFFYISSSLIKLCSIVYFY